MKKNIVFLLILIPIIWISCDGMGHQTIDFRKIENLMPQHPDSALMLLEQIENKENLSRKDKAHYYLLLTEAEDKTYVTHKVLYFSEVYGLMAHSIARDPYNRY